MAYVTAGSKTRKVTKFDRYCSSWGHVRPEEWARVHLRPPPSGKVVKCFDALVMTVNRSVDELFMHYFQNIRRLLEALPPDPQQGSVYGPRWGRKPQTP